MQMRIKEQCKLRHYLQLTLSLHWRYVNRDHYARNFPFHEGFCKQSRSVTLAVKVSHVIRIR